MRQWDIFLFPFSTERRHPMVTEERRYLVARKIVEVLRLPLQRR